jgi:hypothetical protein
VARYKEYSYDQIKLTPISFERQILPGTFEYTLSCLIDREVDLLVFESRYRNDESRSRGQAAGGLSFSACSISSEKVIP